MNIINYIKSDKIDRAEIEQVQKQKNEYTLLGQYTLKKGMKLFSYNYKDGIISEVVLKFGEFITCELTSEGWIWYDQENANVNIDTKLDYFQSPSITIAKNLVQKLKDGKIKYLFNLTKMSNKIDLFKTL